MGSLEPSFSIGIEEEYLLVDIESRDLVVEAGVAVNGVDLDFVQQLDARHFNAAGHDVDHAVHGRLNVGKRAHSRGNCRRIGMQTKGHFCNYSQRTFRSDQEPC